MSDQGEHFIHDGIVHPISQPLAFPADFHAPETGLAPVQLHVHPAFEGGFGVEVQAGPLHMYEEGSQNIPSAEKADAQYGIIGFLALAYDVAPEDAFAVGVAWIKSAGTIARVRDPGDLEVSWLDGRRMGHIGCDAIGFYWVRGQGIVQPKKSVSSLFGLRGRPRRG